MGDFQPGGLVQDLEYSASGDHGASGNGGIAPFLALLGALSGSLFTLHLSPRYYLIFILIYL